MKVCGISFKNNGKVYFFKHEDINLEIDDNVVIENEKGQQLAKVVDINIDPSRINDYDSLKSIIRKSTKKDYDNYLKNLKEAADVLNYTNELINIYDLKMKTIDCNYTLDRKQLTINFVSEDRIDFRNLVKDLASKYKTRIELHQLGVRDKAKYISGIGPCGQQLCCTRFLKNMDTISINMAKNQNISLNPQKINGICGRLLCCLSYEDETYSEIREKLPKIGEIIKTDKGEGKVVSLDVLNKKYTVLINGDKYEFRKD